MIKKTITSICLIGMSAYASAGCYIMGDSIAQGIAMNRKDCSSETKVGLNTINALKYWSKKGVTEKDKIIISLGVNDGNFKTEENLNLLRGQMLRANQVIWILPPKNDKSIIVRRLATRYGDYVLNIDSQLGSDRIHPTGKGYMKIADHIKRFQYE
jgi:lysophospholipase L1-like esterase